MAIATALDLRDYMSGIKMTVPQILSASQIIQGVQEELELYLNRPLELTAMREAVVTDESGFARLAVSPVYEIRRVSPVSASGGIASIPVGILPTSEPMPTFNGKSYDVVPPNLGKDLIYPGGLILPSPNSYYVVEYVGGGGDFVARHINAVRNGILRVAAREWKVMHDDSMIAKNGTVSEPVDSEPTKHKGWQEDELVNFDRLRRRVVV